MEYEKYTLAQLRQLAKEKGAKNVSKLKREELYEVLNSEKFARSFSEMQREELLDTVRVHILQNYLKMNAPINNNLAATPTAEQRAKLTPADEAARLWGEEPENPYTPHL